MRDNFQSYGELAMSKKSKKRHRSRRRQVAPAKFFTDTPVRVKPGTTDSDFPDIPLGGWSGTITEVDARSNPPTYLIEWDQRTLSQMHPVYRNRCERDGLGVESMWLHENDIEPDNGEPASIEQPTQIVTRPIEDKRPGRPHPGDLRPDQRRSVAAGDRTTTFPDTTISLPRT